MQDQQDRQAPETTVTVKCTGRVRTRVGDSRFEYSFAGETLRAFLGAFFNDYDVSDMLIAETEAEASTDGWASGPAELPGENYAKNPEGEQTRPTPGSRSTAGSTSTSTGSTPNWPTGTRSR